MARDLVNELDRSMPAAQHAKLGTTLQTLIANFNAVLVKMDAAAAATVAALGTNNVATLTVTDLVTAGKTAL